MRSASPPDRAHLVALALITTLSLAGCGVTGPAHQAAPADAIVIQMTNGFAFSPATLSVPVGGTVEWRNVSLFEHTVTADPARAADATTVQLPQGAAPFHAAVPAGEVYRHKFDVAGTYRYVCLPHEDDGMVGTIIVQAPAGG